MMRLREYRDQIDRLIRGESDLGFMLNGSEAHAAIIVERMFAHAQSEMCIVTQHFDPAIYADDEVLLQAESFASNPETKTRILVENISDESLGIHHMNELASALPNIEVRRLPSPISKKLTFNFSVMDRKGYRFEEDKNKVNALVRFNDQPFAVNIADYFDKLWDVSPSS